MTGLRTWWRRFGGLLAAVLTLVLVVPATADAAICLTEEASAASVQSVGGDTSIQAADPGDGPTKGHLGAQGCLCQHGHCHHSSSVPPSSAAEPATHPVAAAVLQPPESRERPARFATRLDRPPRG